jgi:acyl-CoA thioester hydrolase
VGLLEEFKTMSALLLQPCEPSAFIQFDETLHPSPFQCEIEITPEQSSNEVDHVNNIEYLRWIDKASQLHCDACGWTRERLMQDGMMWFVARHEIDYRSEAKSTDRLRLTTWVDDVRRVKSWRTTYIHAIGDTQRIVCKCKTLWVLVDIESRAPKTVPQVMADNLQPLTPPRGLAS